MEYDVQWRLSSDQVLLQLFQTCLIDEETRNFLNCHKFYLYPNHHIIKFYHFFEIPSTPRMFNPLPSAQYVRMHMLRPPKKVLKIIKTKQKRKMKKKQEQQRQQIRNRRQKLCSCPSDFLCKQKQCVSVDWRQLGYFIRILNIWFVVIGISDSSRDLNVCLLFYGCYIYFLIGSSFFFASFSFWLLMFEILRQKVCFTAECWSGCFFFYKRKGARSYSPNKRMTIFPVNEHLFFLGKCNQSSLLTTTWLFFIHRYMQ